MDKIIFTQLTAEEITALIKDAVREELASQPTQTGGGLFGGALQSTQTGGLFGTSTPQPARSGGGLFRGTNTQSTLPLVSY